MARHEEASSKPQEAASGWASEHVDAIKVRFKICLRDEDISFKINRSL
jgi:hypothetical protein